MTYRARPIANRFNQLAERERLHRDHRAKALRDVPLEQLFRLHLLATAMVTDNGPPQEGMFVLVAPEANRHVARAAEAYRRHLREEHEATVAFRQVSTETCIKAIRVAGDPELSSALHERYTDFQPVHALIAEWEPHQPATPA